MKRMLPVAELARDERFHHMSVEEVIFDPRNASPKAQHQHAGADATRTPARTPGPSCTASSSGEIQALEGAGRTCWDFETGDGREDAPFALKLDMARQCWDEARHVEISCKLSDHMGSDDRRVRRADAALRGGLQPRSGAAPDRRQPGARGPGHRRVQDHAGLRDDADRSGPRLRRGLDAGRRGHPREDGLGLAAPAHGQRPRPPEAGPRVPAGGRQAVQLRGLPGRAGREPDPPGPQLPPPGRLHRRRDRRPGRHRRRGLRRGRSRARRPPWPPRPI